MKIKVVHKMVRAGWPSFQYSPDYLFTKDGACDDYDWLVAYDDACEDDGGLARNGCEPLMCPKERTILATWEPTSIKCYSKAFAGQFGHLLTNRPWEAERHPHYHLGRGYFYWYNDRDYSENVAAKIPPKTRTVSVVCSSKKMRFTQHYARYKLVEALSRGVPDLDWYGHGVRSFGKKFEVMDPYRYHVAVENHIAPHHWTEKLADAFLCECLPFYAGDPAIFEVFPKESLIPIPIDDPAEAVRIVNAAIADGEYEKRREAVLEAKRLILEKYNFWAQVISVIEASAGQAVTPVDPAHPVMIYGRKALRRRNLSSAWEQGWFRFRQSLRLT